MIYVGDKELKNAYIGDTPVKKIYRGDVLLWQKQGYALVITAPTEGQEFEFGNTITTNFEVSGFTNLQITSPTEGQEFEFGNTIITSFNIS